MTRTDVVALLVAVYIATGGVAHASPKLIECPDHTHVWNSQDCDSAQSGGGGGPFTFPGGGGGGNNGGSGGLLGIVHRVTGGLL